MGINQFAQALVVVILALLVQMIVVALTVLTVEAETALQEINQFVLAWVKWVAQFRQRAEINQFVLEWEHDQIVNQLAVTNQSVQVSVK